MTRKTLKTYYTANYKRLGHKIAYGGSVFPPHISVESEVRVRCPVDRGKVLSMAACRLETHTQFGQEQLLFHGTAIPESRAFPGAEEDHLRWYAFDANMSLDYIKEESHARSQQGLPSKATLYVYRVRKPIRNLLLFADYKQWLTMGGAETLFVNNICGVSHDPTTEQGKAMGKRAKALGAPIDEYARAAGVSQLRFVRGDRGEHANGWVRVNSTSLIGSDMVLSKGFEFLFTHPDHTQFLELVGTYDVVDDSQSFGTVASDVQDASSELEWHMTAFSPTPRKASRRASIGAASPGKKRRLSF